MASENGSENPGLGEQLLAQADRFGFFQAVRLLERLPGADDSRGRRFPVGYDHAADREVVRFRAQPAQSFPPSEIAQLLPQRAGNAAAPPEMVVSFMGLTGPQGVLPAHYTALLIRRVRAKDFALRDFLDLLNHRTISLFFRSWEKYRLPFRYERSRSEPGEARADLGTFCLYCLVGLGTEGLRGRSGIDDEFFLFYAGHFARLGRSATALEAMLEDYFEVPARVLEAQGQWLSLEPEDRSLLPTLENRKGENCQLGVNAIAGERVWDVQSKVRLRLGPLSYAQFRSFLPDGEALRPLCRLARHYLGREFHFDVQLVLKAQEIPACRLASEGPDRPLLGWNTWVRCEEFTTDQDAPVFVDETV